MDKDCYLLGIGHNTVAFLDLVEACGMKVAGLYHYNEDRTGEIYYGVPIIGSFADLEKNGVCGKSLVLTMGDINIRKSLYEKYSALGAEFPRLIHPSAVVSPRATLGIGVVVMENSTVQGGSIIGDNSVITINAFVAHSSCVGKHCFISGLSIIGALAQVEDEVHIGQGAIIVSGGYNIGQHSILGAGSVVRANMQPNSIYLGNPARFVKFRE